MPRRDFQRLFPVPDIRCATACGDLGTHAFFKNASHQCGTGICANGAGLLYAYSIDNGSLLAHVDAHEDAVSACFEHTLFSHKRATSQVSVVCAFRAHGRTDDEWQYLASVLVPPFTSKLVRDMDFTYVVSARHALLMTVLLSCEHRADMWYAV